MKRGARLFVIAGLLSFPSLSHATHAQEIRHYFFVGMDREKLHDTAFLNTPALEGAQVAYFWKQLEHEKDEYDFSLIREDLAFLRSHGKKLFIQLQDVTFRPALNSVPRYLIQDTVYHGGAATQYRIKGDDEKTATPLGWVTRRWDPAVQDRLGKLLFALGKEFDGRVEGINSEESSVSFGETGALFPAGFNPIVYRDALIANMRTMRRAFPTSVVMQYANFMPGEWRPTNDRGYLVSVYRAAREARVGLGGPDLLPHRPGQLGSSYPLLREAAGIVPTGIAVQDGNFADLDPATGQPVTIENLFAFARDSLKVTYIFWGTEEPYYSRQVIPFLRALSTKR